MGRSAPGQKVRKLPCFRSVLWGKRVLLWVHYHGGMCVRMMKNGLITPAYFLIFVPRLITSLRRPRPWRHSTIGDHETLRFRKDFPSLSGRSDGARWTKVVLSATSATSRTVRDGRARRSECCGRPSGTPWSPSRSDHPPRPYMVVMLPRAPRAQAGRAGPTGPRATQLGPLSKAGARFAASVGADGRFLGSLLLGRSAEAGTWRALVWWHRGAPWHQRPREAHFQPRAPRHGSTKSAERRARARNGRLPPAHRPHLAPHHHHHHHPPHPHSLTLTPTHPTTLPRPQPAGVPGGRASGRLYGGWRRGSEGREAEVTTTATLRLTLTQRMRRGAARRGEAGRGACGVGVEPECTNRSRAHPPGYSFAHISDAYATLPNTFLVAAVDGPLLRLVGGMMTARCAATTMTVATVDDGDWLVAVSG